MSILKTLTINGTTYNVAPVVPACEVTLLASAWVGDGDAYSQVVGVPGVTEHTKVDLQPTAEQVADFYNKVLAFVAENNGGTVTVYAIGEKPTEDHTIQVTKTEVEGTGKIRGDTVGTPTKPEKILLECQNLTEEEKAIARENIGASSKASVKIENGILVVEGGSGASADLPVVVAKFYSEDGATLTCESHTADEILGYLKAGTPVVAHISDQNIPRYITCTCWGDDYVVYVGDPIFDGGWQHAFTDADHYDDGDVSNKTIGNELWREH